MTDDPIRHLPTVTGHMRLLGRNREIWHLYAVQRWTQTRIAEKYEISQPQVAEIVRKMRESIGEPTIAEIREKSLALHSELMERLMAVVEMPAPPVTAGKDGDIVLDPETGKVVRDYAAHLAALRDLLKVDAETRKLMGADAATKTESTASVKYEIVGVDIEDLK